MMVKEARDARVPQQLLSPTEDSGEKGSENEVEDVVEFAAVGAASVAGYTAPLGMSPDAVGRKKNRPRLGDK